MTRLPSLFVSHGAPTWALAPGEAGVRLGALARRLPRPEAVLVVSPHWTTRDVRVGTAPRPETIHDFGGFDPALYRIRYPAPGHPELAAAACAALLASVGVYRIKDQASLAVRIRASASQTQAVAFTSERS